MVLACLREGQWRARAPNTRQSSEAASVARLLKLSNAASRIDRPSNKYMRSVFLVQFPTLFFDQAIQLVQQLTIAFANRINYTSQHGLNAFSTAAE